MSDEIPDPAAYESTLVESFSWRYSNKRDVWSWEPALQEAAEFIFAFLPDEPGLVLDIGTGTGERLAAALDSGHRALGIDLIRVPEWEAIESKTEGRARFVAGNFLGWEGPEGSFQLIADLGCFHHQHPEDYHRYLSKVRRHLADDGVFGLCIYLERADVEAGSMETTNHGRLAKNFTQREIRALLEQASLQPLKEAVIERPALGSAYLVVVSEPIAVGPSGSPASGTP